HHSSGRLRSWVGRERRLQRGDGARLDGGQAEGCGRRRHDLQFPVGADGRGPGVLAGPGLPRRTRPEAAEGASNEGGWRARVPGGGTPVSSADRAVSMERSDYAALSDRMGNLLVLRFAMGAIVVTWAALRPEAVGIDFAALLAATFGYLAVSAALEIVRRRSDRFGFALLTFLLLFDGLYLAYAMYGTGGTQSPIRFLVYLDLVAVSLLASYRTGLKIALWHSLLLLVVLYPQPARLVPPIEVTPGSAIEFDRMPVLNVTSFWLFAIATSVFSALNERDLRLRRADLQSMVDVGGRLDDLSDPLEQARIVLAGLVDRFEFKRGIVLGAPEGRMLALATH